MNKNKEWSPLELLMILQTSRKDINDNLAMLFGRTKDSLMCKKENFNYIHDITQNPRKRKYKGLKNYSERDELVYKYFSNLYVS